MVGPRDLSRAELQRCGLARIYRSPKSGEAVTRVYCLRCGRQVDAERMDTDPDGWWTCARGCNTLYEEAPPPGPTTRPQP